MPVNLTGPRNAISVNLAAGGSASLDCGLGAVLLASVAPLVLTGLFITTGSPATATATTHAPTVSYARAVTTGGPATATPIVHAPSVAYGLAVTSGAPATANATVHAPEVAVSAALTTGAPATADATVYAPTVSYGQSITTGSPAQATATVYAPIVNAGASLSIETGAPATCAPITRAPEVSYGLAVVTGAPATASASVLAPAVSYGASVSSGTPATAAASVFAPSVSYGAAVVTGSPATASAIVLAPSVTYGQSLTTGAPATATGTTLAPTVTTGGGGFTPEDLFASGEKGFFHDMIPENLNTLSTNAGSTPGLGDPIGYAEDLSGNAVHSTQPTAAFRLTLRQTGGGLYYAELDGADDLMVGVGGWAVSSTLTIVISGFIASSSVINNDGLITINVPGGGRAQRGMGTTGTTLKADVRGFSASPPELITSACVMEAEFPEAGAAGVIQAAVNGGTFSNSVSFTPLNTTQNYSIGVGLIDVRIPASIFSILVIDRALTAGERTDLLNWMATRGGVTL